MIKIRKALLSDIPEVLTIEYKSFTYEAFTKKQFISILRSKNSMFFVAETEHGIAGYIILFKRKNCNFLRIYSIAVDPALRGMHIGRDLLTHAEKITKEMNMNTLTLEVHQENQPAILFYFKHGFAVTQEIPDYYNPGVNAFKMKKILN